MSKTLLRSLFRPYICKSCRHRTRSPKPPLRRSISVVQGREAINNAEQVQRRIEALGGEEEVRSLYQRFPLKPREQLLSPNEFTLGYQEKWLKLEDESRQRAKVAIYGRRSWLLGLRDKAYGVRQSEAYPHSWSEIGIPPA